MFLYGCLWGRFLYQFRSTAFKPGKSILFISLAVACFFVSFGQNTEWVVSLGGPNSDKGISIGTDSLGFIYASGYFNTTATFGTVTLTNSSPSGNNKEVFLHKALVIFFVL